MPRGGGGTFQNVPGTTVSPNTTIQSAWANAFSADVEATFNTEWPLALLPTISVAKGGTGSTTASDARTALGLAIGSDIPNFPSISGSIYGLTLSNNVTDPTNDVDVAIGTAVNSTNTAIMTLASPLTKRLDAVWAVGSGNGGLDTGAIANATYHVFQIKRPDTGVVDALFSLSPTSPTLPANYTLFRRIGFIVRNGGTILGFTQYGNTFKLSVPTTPFSSTTPASNALQNIVGSGGVRVIPLLGLLIQKGTVGDSFIALGDGDTATATNTVVRVATAGEYSAGNASFMYTNTSGQLRLSLANNSGTVVDARVFLHGWTDYTL